MHTTHKQLSKLKIQMEDTWISETEACEGWSTGFWELSAHNLNCVRLGALHWPCLKYGARSQWMY